MNLILRFGEFSTCNKMLFHFVTLLHRFGKVAVSISLHCTAAVVYNTYMVLLHITLIHKYSTTYHAHEPRQSLRMGSCAARYQVQKRCLLHRRRADGDVLISTAALNRRAIHVTPQTAVEPGLSNEAALRDRQRCRRRVINTK